AQAVGEIAKRPAFERLRLDENHVAVLIHDLEVGAGLGPRTLRLLAHTLELGAQLLGFARLLVQPCERLAARQRLDPPRARADRSLGEDRERADLGGRAHVRAAAELARVPGDLDDANDLAVLLPEEHPRSEVARLFDRGLEGTHRQVLEDL